MDIYYNGELLTSGEPEQQSLFDLIVASEQSLALEEGQSLICYVDGRSVFDFTFEELNQQELSTFERVDFKVLSSKESGEYASRHLREQIIQIDQYFVDLHYITKDLDNDEDAEAKKLDLLSESELFIRLSALSQKLIEEFFAFFSSLNVFLNFYKVSKDNFVIGGDRLEFFVDKFSDEIRYIQVALDSESFEFLSDSLYKLQQYFHDLKVMYHELMSTYKYSDAQEGKEGELS